MQQSIGVVIGSAPADKVQLKLAECCQKLLTKKSHSRKFTPRGEEILYKLPIIVYVNKKDIGTTRIASAEEVLTLLGHSKFMSQPSMLQYLNSVPQNLLASLTLTFIFLPYSNEMRIARHLQRMLAYLEHLKKNSHAGKIDYLSLEQDLQQLLKGDSVATLIPLARKHSYIKVLGIKSKGGYSHAER